MEKLRVLIVDDELGMRLAVSRAIERFSVRFPEMDGELGFEMDQAATGEEALEKIKTSPPDILLLDYKLPGLSGLEILGHLAEEGKDLLTIVITAYASLETAVSATKRGAYDFLAKPFTPEELKAALSKAARHLTLQRQAKKLAEEKRQFRFQTISLVAHELKAPIAAVEGYLRIIQERSVELDQAIYDRMVDRSLLRLQGMRKLIKDLLDLTWIESGQVKRKISELDAREVARSVFDTFISSAGDRSISMRLRADRPIPMSADRDEMEMILNNLLSNAIKYNRDGGEVELFLGLEDGKIVIRVSDTGIGMTPEETSRLFNEFVRIKNPKTLNILGSGLGLSIVQKLAHLYGGEVSVTSQPDQGSTFRVVLNDGASARPLEEANIQKEQILSE